MIVKFDGGREVSFETEKVPSPRPRLCRHKSLVAGERLLIGSSSTPIHRNRELLLNDRMGYVAVSRAREDATIYTNSIEDLRGALDRRVDREMALEAVQVSNERRNELRDDKNPYESQNRESLTSQQAREPEITEEANQDRGDAEVAEAEEMEFSLA